MLGRTAIFALIVLVGAGTASPATAQDDNAPTRRTPSLSDRLERFRQDLLGDSRSESQPSSRSASNEPSGASRKITNQPRLADSSPAPVKPTAASIDVQPGSAIPGGNSSITVPSRLKPQAARRARPSSGPSPAMIEPADRGEPEEPAEPTPARQPVERQETRSRLRASDESADEVRLQPRIARSLPLPAAPKDPEPEVEEPPRIKKIQAASTGVLFTSQGPALNLEATGPGKIPVGKEAKFLIKIRNTGAAANNVTVTINIPNDVDVISAQASAGSASPPGSAERREALEWKITRLEAKRSETLTLKIVPRKNTPLDLGVQWTFTPEVLLTSIEVQEPKLIMSIAGPNEVLYGQSKIYKLTVSNPGNGDTENVTVALMPIGRASEGGVNHRVGTLLAGESKTFDIELTARQAGAITIKAQAFADGGLRSEAAEQVLVRRANLHVEVQAPKIKYAGTVGTYRVTVVNAGNSTAENVQVAALLPPDSKYVSSNGGGKLETQQNKVNWTIGTLQSGGKRVFEIQCVLNAPGENRMQFITMADGDLSAAATSETRVEALADLKLEVRDPQGPIAVGEDMVYEVHIRNRGTKAAEGIDLAVFFSEGLEATSVEGGPYEIGPGQVVFQPFATLAAGETTVCHIHARADKSGNHVFRAEVVCPSLHTKLAAEETTHFYGDDKAVPAEVARRSEPPQSSEPAADEQSPETSK